MSIVVYFDVDMQYRLRGSKTSRKKCLQHHSFPHLVG